MTTLCPYCFFKQKAERLRALAKAWDDQRLPNLSSPHHKAAAVFEAMTDGEGRCKCGEPLLERKLKVKKRDLEADVLPDPEQPE